ncbi:MAG: ankyrin repeat domain-containing protein [Planctomycetota bacterium]
MYALNEFKGKVDMGTKKWHPMLIKLMNFAVNDPKLARKLVKEHPEVLNLRTAIGETALHYLAIENYSDAVQLLIDLGADVNVENEFGKTVLHEAIICDAQPTIAILKSAGAKDNGKHGTARPFKFVKKKTVQE